METATRSKTANVIYSEIKTHINSSPHSVSKWYVGITQNVNQRLFGTHNVSKDNGWWVYRKAYFASDARKVEAALIEYGCDGGVGGGDSDALYVYAYYKAANTKR